VALLGRNGAGKTTTLRSILGLTPARRGQIIFKGTDITRLATHRIVRSGIAFVPEDRGIFLTVTVEEHLAIAYGASKHRPTRKPIEHVLDIFPGSPSGGTVSADSFQAVSSRCWQSGAR
jgi:branched-chain amino acid transport system ATP-binding protein